MAALAFTTLPSSLALPNSSRFDWTTVATSYGIVLDILDPSSTPDNDSLLLTTDQQATMGNISSQPAHSGLER
jgi:hypothetical protein